jgi:hypothetical protein
VRVLSGMGERQDIGEVNFGEEKRREEDVYHTQRRDKKLTQSHCLYMS